jgi:hypothetical protein
MKLIMSWCPGQTPPSPCDPCKPSLPGGGGDTGLPPFTDAAVKINQVQVNTGPTGQQTSYALGSMIIYSAVDNIPPQGAFGVPLVVGPVETSSIVSSVVLYQSSIQILHPWYPPGSYPSALPETTSGPLGTTVTDPGNLQNNAASTAAGNAAIAQANQVLGNP